MPEKHIRNGLRITFRDKNAVLNYLFKKDVNGVDFYNVKKRFDFLSYLDEHDFIFYIIEYLAYIDYSFSFLADCELDNYDAYIIKYILREIRSDVYKSDKYNNHKNLILCKFIDNGYFWFIKELIDCEVFKTIDVSVKLKLKYIKNHELNDDLISLNELGCYELLKDYL